MQTLPRGGHLLQSTTISISFIISSRVFDDTARLPPINESSNQHSADGGAWGSGKINVPHVTPTKETSP